MSRRLLVLLVLAVLVAAGAVAVLWFPGAPALTLRATALWPFAPEDRARRAVAAIEAHDAATLGALVTTPDHANLAAADGEPLLLHAIAAKDRAAVGLLLSRGADPARAGKAQRSPLLRAAELHLTELLRMLTAKGARVQEVPGKPLLLSLPSVAPEELQILLAAGANPYLARERARPLFLIAAGEENPARLAIILQSPIPPPPELKREALALAVAGGRPANVTLLLAAGADPKQDPGLGWTALTNGRVDLLQMLLDAGLDPDWHPPQESLPLVEAAERGFVDVVRALLARPGKRPGLDDALLVAALADKPEVAGVIRAAGAALPADAGARQAVEHALSKAAVGPGAPPDRLHKPVPPTWDGPLLVGTYLLEKCGQSGGGQSPPPPAKWSDVDLPVSSLGRAQGDEVQALLFGGKAVRARFGAVSCVPGACGQGWYGAALDGAASRDVLAVAPPGFVPAKGKVSALKKSAGKCSAPVPAAPAEGKWTRTCSVWHGPGKLAVEVLEYDAVGDVYEQAVVHARMLGKKPGPWLAVRSRAGLAPKLAIEAPGAPLRLVFWRAGGVATGDSIVCMARAGATGKLELGRCYAAGGQPCD